MQAILIGVGSGLLSIFTILQLRKLDEVMIYAFILVGIGYLYVGFTWSDTGSLVICSAQALLFMLIACFGMRNIYILAGGFFLHGIWDIIFGIFPISRLIPPHYDLFCLSIDLVMGLYLILAGYRRCRTANLNPVV